MRIDRLDLRAFGPFTGLVLDFSEGQEGLHVIFGPNEAGKSSALRAITQMFYGIPTRSTDDFIHQKTQMRIGAVIRNGQDTLNFIRRKGAKSTLRDEQDEKTLDETELQAFLDDLDEDTFRTVFGLHHEQLVEGGRMILDGQGNIGEALFAASAGLSGLRNVMASLQEETGELFKPSTASRPRINAAISEFRNKKKELKALQLRPEEWARADKALNYASSEREEIEDAIKELAAKRNRLGRILEAVPLLARRQNALLSLEPVAEAVFLPEDFQERRRTLMQKQREASSEKKRALERQDEIASALANLLVNEELLAEETRVEELYLRSASNKKALKDSREKLQPECQLLEGQAKQILASLRPAMSLKQIETLRLSAPQRGHIHELGQQRDMLDSQRKQAQGQFEKLKIEKERTKAALARTENVCEPTDLARCIRRVQKHGDLEEQLDISQHEHDVDDRAVRSALSRLELWEGTIEDFERLPVPSPDTIDDFRGRFDAQRNRLDELKLRRDELEESQRSVQIEIETLRREQDVPTEDELYSTRGVRKSAWQLVRDSWERSIPPKNIDSETICGILAGLELPEEKNDNLADAYELVTDKADELSDRLRREADRVARLAQLEVTAGDIEQRLADVRLEYEDAEEDRVATEEEWDALWRPLGINPRTPREMAAWAQKQRALVDQVGDLRSRCIKIDGLRKRIEAFKADLSDALHAVGESETKETETLAALLDRANDVVADKCKAIQAREQLQTHLESIDAKEMPVAEHAVEESTIAFDEWQLAWHKAMEELGEAVDTTPKKAGATIQEIDDLFSAFDKAKELKRRIEQISQDDQEFQENVEELIRSVVPDFTGSSAEQAIVSLHENLQRSKSDSTRMEDLKSQQDGEEERGRKADAALTRIDEDVMVLCNEAQVENADALPDAEERSQVRRHHERALREIDERLVELSSGASLDVFLAMVREKDPDTLEPDIAQLDQEVEEKERALKRISEEIGEHRKELGLMDGSADAAQVADEAQALLARMTADVEQYTRLRISELVLARAIEQYREKNQGPLLRRAGEFFSELTMGSFTNLIPDFNDKGEDVLVGLRANTNTSVPISGMSDGTADQLYLALRLASLELYLEKHPPIPFILDDILINFDDDRAVAVLKTLASISQHTQILFFTHHQHLVRLAEENLEQEILFTHTLS